LEDNVGKVFNALQKADQETTVAREKEAVAAEVPETESVTQPPASPEAAQAAPGEQAESVPVEPVASAPIEDEEPGPVAQAAAEEARVVKEHVAPEPERKKAKTKAPQHAPAAMQRNDWDERLTQAAAAGGTVAESFRALRTRILHPESGQTIRNILVTSASPGEGKSFVCANLGICFAQGVDNQGLLVDCDLRKPALAKLFGLANDHGLVNYLRDREDLSSLIHETGVDQLRIVPAGPPPVNPAELLGSDVMQHLVEELGSRYDDRIVLFDSPPMHAAAETSILAKHVDAVVLVVRSGGSRREYVQSVVDQIGKEKIIGIVFNAYTTTLLDNKMFGAYEYQYKAYYGEQ
jgi:exopolysaccharide/PEP-CTERM locus tyrosine autokinase